MSAKFCAWNICRIIFLVGTRVLKQPVQGDALTVICDRLKIKLLMTVFLQPGIYEMHVFFTTVRQHLETSL